MSGLLLTGGSYFGVERLVPSTLRYRHSLEHSGLKPENWLSAGRTSKAGGVGRVRATALPAPVLDVGLPVPFVVLHSEEGNVALPPASGASVLLRPHDDFAGGLDGAVRLKVRFGYLEKLVFPGEFLKVRRGGYGRIVPSLSVVPSVVATRLNSGLRRLRRLRSPRHYSLPFLFRYPRANALGSRQGIRDVSRRQEGVLARLYTPCTPSRVEADRSSARQATLLSVLRGFPSLFFAVLCKSKIQEGDAYGVEGQMRGFRNGGEGFHAGRGEAKGEHARLFPRRLPRRREYRAIHGSGVPKLRT